MYKNIQIKENEDIEQTTLHPETNIHQVLDFSNGKTLGEIINNLQVVIPSQPLGSASNYSVESLTRYIAVRWEDPDDVTYINAKNDRTIISRWVAAKVIMKVGSPPTSVTDGIVVVETQDRNKYKSKGFGSGWIVETGVLYYIGIFVYNDVGMITAPPSYLSFTPAPVYLDNVSNFSIVVVSGSIYVVWTDPLDTTTVFNGDTVPAAEWIGTVIVRKEGSEPTGPSDGVVLGTIQTRNNYNASPFIIINLIEGKTYHVKLFPATMHQYTNNSANSKSATIVYSSIGNVSNFSVTSSKNSVNIKWTDPTNTTALAHGIYVSDAVWAGTKLVRKSGSAPTSPTDGTLLVDSKTRNSYSSYGYTDSGLTYGTRYHYKLFPYTVEGKITNDANNSKSIMMVDDQLEAIVTMGFDVAGSNMYITWHDPTDKFAMIDGNSVKTAEWAGTWVVVKAGSEPTSYMDGTLRLDVKIRNKHSSSPLIIPNNSEYTMYYIKLFPYTAGGIVTSTGQTGLVSTSYPYLDNVSSFSVTNSNNSANIKWTDPNNLTRNVMGITVNSATWAGTKLVRKSGSAPTSPTDGTLLVDSKTRNSYSSYGYTDSGLTYGTTYHYKLFPYSTDNKVTNSGANSKSITLEQPRLDEIPMAGFATADNKLYVGWRDPSDKYVSGNSGAKTAEWAGTWVVIKEGSIPTSYTDGTWRLDVKTRDKYISSPLIIDNRLENTDYFIKLFPYTTGGVMTNPVNYDALYVQFGPLGNVSGLSVTTSKTNATIKWTDPDNKTLNVSFFGNITLDTVVWAGTKLVRKAGSVPTSPTDGTLLLDSKTRNKYSSTGYTDTGLTNGTTYYYKLFPYSTRNKVTDSNSNSGNVKIVWNGVPGSPTLIGGNTTTGFYGEVLAGDFITGDDLASLIGLTSGTSINSTTPWLKFSIDNKIIFTPKKPIRRLISWTSIDAVSAVYGNRTVTILGKTYKIRLFRGAQNDPAVFTDSDRDSNGSEWNRLMMPIHEHAPSSWDFGNQDGFTAAVIAPTADWNINYTDADLSTYHNNYSIGGSLTWCQEAAIDVPTQRITRGFYEVSYIARTSTDSTANTGWRPVLELVN